MLKFLILAAIGVFALILMAGLINKIGEPAKITVNVPAQAPPVISAPKAEPPIINLPPVTVAPVSSPAETISLIIAALMLSMTIGLCIFVVKKLNAQERSMKPAERVGPVVPMALPQPIEYVRTSYGWTPKRTEAIPAEQIAPGLFTQKPE